MANGEYAEILTCDVEGYCRVVSNESETVVTMRVEEEKDVKAIEENSDTLARIEAQQNAINTLWTNASISNRQIEKKEEVVAERECTKTKVKINELTSLGLDKLNRLTQELNESQRDKDASLVDIIMKKIEIYKLINDINSEYSTGKQRECEIQNK